MKGNLSDRQIKIFSTCPPLNHPHSNVYLNEIREVALWSEKAGCTGILVYSDNSQLDPWLIAQEIIQQTHSLSPLIAVQPVYMHPYTVAKKIVSLSLLYDRRICLNLVAGGFKNDLIALNDMTPHDERYLRLTEYTLIIKHLLENSEPVTFEGNYYQIKNLKLTPRLPEELLPELYMSGSSAAGLTAAKKVGATAIQYPLPVEEYTERSGNDKLETGIRIGVVCRENSKDAWYVAHERFPEDRKGQIIHALAMKVSDSVWHRQLSNLTEDDKPENPYWLVPFKNYKTMCPYLVGDYERVGKELSMYLSWGYKTFILDVPGKMEDLIHIKRAFEKIKKAS